MSLYKLFFQLEDIYDSVQNGYKIPAKDVYDPAIKIDSKINLALNKANEIWLASDWHLWGNDDIINKSFKNLVKYQHSLVKDNDIFLYLGDFINRGTEAKNVKQKLGIILKSLRGKKILVSGNHDIFENSFYLKNGFSFVVDAFKWNRYVFSHIPIRPDKLSKDALNIHGHLHAERYPFFDKRYICIYSLALENKCISLQHALKLHEKRII